MPPEELHKALTLYSMQRNRTVSIYRHSRRGTSQEASVRKAILWINSPASC